MLVKPKLLVIVGPTASGKSALAIRLAKKFHGEVVSADSRQVYRGLNIGTGKMTKKEMRGVPHHLLDATSPNRQFTVVQYQKLAERAIRDISKRGRLPILCGGTGFYIDAVLYGNSFPSAPANKELRRKLAKRTASELLAELQKRDPDRAAAIDPKNKVRLIRALEIVLTTGKPVPALRKASKYEALKLGILLPKKELKRNINSRIQTWLRHGLLKEVEGLHKKGLGWKRLHELGLEYRYPALRLQGKLTRPEMVRKMETETWRYAKRQMTWFKRDKDIHWVKTIKEAEKLILKLLPARRSSGKGERT